MEEETTDEKTSPVEQPQDLSLRDPAFLNSARRDQYTELILLVMAFVVPVGFAFWTRWRPFNSAERIFGLLTQVFSSAPKALLATIAFAIDVLIPGFIGVIVARYVVRSKNELVRFYATYLWIFFVLVGFIIESCIFGLIPYQPPPDPMLTRMVTVVRTTRLIPAGQRFRASDLRVVRVLATEIAAGDLISPVPIVCRRAKVDLDVNKNINEIDVRWEPRSYEMNIPALLQEIIAARSKWNSFSDMSSEEKYSARGEAKWPPSHAEWLLYSKGRFFDRVD